MTGENLIVVVFFGMLAAMIAISIVVARIAKRLRSANESTLAREATARGWQFESGDSGRFRLLRWRGTTDGVSWVAEFRRDTDRHDRTAIRRHRSRWRADSTLAVGSAVLVLPEGSEIHRQRSAPAPTEREGGALGALGRLATQLEELGLDKAIDLYFGEDAGAQVDAAALARVDGGAVPGFVVLAADPFAGSRVASSGVAEKIASEWSEPASMLAMPSRPALLLLPTGVHLARITTLDTAEVERLGRIGAAIARAIG